MVPDALKKILIGIKTGTKKERDQQKIMVSLWFSNEANLLTRIGLLDVLRKELKKGLYKQRDQVVSLSEWRVSHV